MTGIEQAQHLGLMQVLDDVEASDKIVALRTIFQEIQHVFLHHIGGHLSGKSDLLRTGIHAADFAITHPFEEIQQFAAAAGHIKNAGFLGIRQPAAQVVAVAAPPSPCCISIESCVGVLKDGCVMRIDAGAIA
ncbi:hypothetical protein WS76_09175 [Burkholderia humptydooensis]|nr:hypothetical protein WS76_09175 [Burkholderia humptydooensis]